MSIASCEEIIAWGKERIGELWKTAASVEEDEIVRCAALERYVELAILSAGIGRPTALWRRLDVLREGSPELLRQVIEEWQRELPRPEKGVDEPGRARGGAVRTRGSVRLRGAAPRGPGLTAAPVGAPKRGGSELSRWFAGIKDE